MPLLGLAALVSAVAGIQAPVTCTSAATQTLVRSFVANLDAGRVDAAARLWAPEPFFQWYSTGSPGARLGTRAYDRATLAAYLRSRVRAHERLTVKRLGAGYDRRRNIVNFSGWIVRRADDGHVAASHPFKGAAACRPGGPRLIVWSM